MKDDIVLGNIVSLKDIKYSHDISTLNDLYKDYDFRIDNPKYEFLEDVLNVPKEEIEANRKVGTILKYKGNLRISWAFDINYNKNIDLIFFPEENPYLNYAVLYAKDFPKTIDKDADIDRQLKEINPPYHINYDFVKEILSQSDLSKVQQERFFQVRFGSVFVPMEIEFEWYGLYIYNENIYTEVQHNHAIRSLLKIAPNTNDILFCLGIIKSHKVLPKDISLNFPAFIEIWGQKTFYKDLFTPLPTAALATTQTNINDFIVNLRDKPDTKEGKIITQLFSQEFSYALLEPKFQKLQEENGWGDEVTFGFMDKEMQEYYKAQQAYYEKEKSKLINPLWRDEYLILVWNIESNNWAKVWALRMPDKKTTNKHGKTFEELMEDYDIRDSVREVISTYTQTFLESPSQLKCYEGYIHCSGLQYLLPFTQNYIKR